MIEAFINNFKSLLHVNFFLEEELVSAEKEWACVSPSSGPGASNMIN